MNDIELLEQAEKSRSDIADAKREACANEQSKSGDFPSI